MQSVNMELRRRVTGVMHEVQRQDCSVYARFGDRLFDVSEILRGEVDNHLLEAETVIIEVDKLRGGAYTYFAAYRMELGSGKWVQLKEVRGPSPSDVKMIKNLPWVSLKEGWNEERKIIWQRPSV